MSFVYVQSEPGLWTVGHYDGSSPPRWHPDSDHESKQAAATRAAYLNGAGVDVAALVAALREVEVICTESAAACRKRMGTRVGNALVVVRSALSKFNSPTE